MSVTCVLVPVDEPEAEALLSGGEPAKSALAAIRDRARTLRARVARVDALREELNDLLFARWEQSRPRPPRWHQRLADWFFMPEPARRSTGYDPFVQVWGRSLPVAGSTPALAAAAIDKVLAADDAAFSEGLCAELRTLDPRAPALWEKTPAPPPPAGLDAAIDAEAAALRESLREGTDSLKPALDAIVRLSAWSRPVWRLDGDMLPDLLKTAGATVEPHKALDVFEDLLEARPGLRLLADKLPARLPDFAGAGSFLGSTDVKMLARSLSLAKLKVETNVGTSDEDPERLMRNVRLVEEALLHGEAHGLALAEAAGVEWHDRPRAGDATDAPPSGERPFVA